MTNTGRRLLVASTLSLAIVAGCAGAIPTQPAATGSGADSTGASAAPFTSTNAAPTATAVAHATVTPTTAGFPQSPALATIVIKAVTPSPALKVAWQTGGPVGTTPNPFAPAVDPQGRIWVASSKDARFWIFDRGGKYLESWGTAGAGQGQFDFVDHMTGDAYGGIAFDPDGSFYVLDTGNDRVEKFDKERHFVSAWGTFGAGDGQFALPTAITTDASGHVYVADSQRLDVQAFTGDGTFVRSIGQGVAGNSRFYAWVAVDRSGYIYSNSGSSIVVYAVDGSPTKSYDLSAVVADPVAIAVDQAGHIYVVGDAGNAPSEYPAVTVELAADGTVLHLWPATGESLALDSAGGTLYAAFYHWTSVRAYTLPKG